MPTLEDVLREKTFKDVEEVERRVFYTLTQDKDLTAHRNSKLLSLIVARLRKTNALSEKEMDELLFEIIH